MLVKGLLICHRFMRLLHKNKFDQAEEFAKQFDLDVEVKLHLLSFLFTFVCSYSKGTIYILVCHFIL